MSGAQTPASGIILRQARAPLEVTFHYCTRDLYSEETRDWRAAQRCSAFPESFKLRKTNARGLALLGSDHLPYISRYMTG